MDNIFMVTIDLKAEKLSTCVRIFDKSSKKSKN